MKKLPILIAVAAVLSASIAFIPPAKSIVGKWVITYKGGTKTYVQFHENGIAKAQMPSEHFEVGGKYKFSQNTVKISDTSCNAAYWGSYKLTFHGTDSIYSEVIADSCGPRRGSLDKVFLIREK